MTFVVVALMVAMPVVVASVVVFSQVRVGVLLKGYLAPRRTEVVGSSLVFALPARRIARLSTSILHNRGRWRGAVAIVIPPGMFWLLISTERRRPRWSKSLPGAAAKSW